MNIDLKSIPFLSDIDEKTLDTFIRNNEIYEKPYGKNSTVHAQGKSCSTIDFICTGSIIAYSLSSNGSENIIFNFKSGSIIGANLLFGKNNSYPMNIYCTSDCTILHISKYAVSELLKNYNFVMCYIKSLSENSLGMNKKIAMYSRRNLRANLLDYITALSFEQKSNSIILPISKKQLADHFGVQRPSLFRELKNLKEEGIIEIKNRQITLHQIEKQEMQTT